MLATVGSLTLICDISFDYQWDIVDNVKTCKPTNVTINHPEQFITKVNTTSDTDDIHGLWVENKNCEYIPRNIESFLPNLRAIRIQDSKLKEISKFDIAPFPALVTLALIGNELQFLNDDLFDYNTKIKSLTLNDTNILIVNGAILMPLNLSVLEFQLHNLKNCVGKCRDIRCMQDTIIMFNQNCEFDSIYPGFKTTANSVKRFIGGKCTEFEDKTKNSMRNSL